MAESGRMTDQRRILTSSRASQDTVDFFLENTTLVILRDFFYGAILWIIKIAFLGLFDQLLKPHLKMRA